MGLARASVAAKAPSALASAAPPLRAASNSQVQICFPFAGGLVGGSHISALKLVEALGDTMYAPLVVLHDADGPVRELIESVGLSYHLAPAVGFLQAKSRTSPRQYAQALGDLARMRRFLVDHEVRIVHTNEGPMHAAWTLPARLAGAKHVWHHRGNPRARGLRLLAPALATRVVCVSNFAAPDPGLWSARGKASVITSPFETSAASIDRRDARALADTKLGLASDTVVLSFVGQFASRKRPLVFIDTIAAVRRARPALRLIAPMFGEEFEPGILAQMRARIEAHGLEDIVPIMGFVYPSEPWLAASDALIVPAVEEPFGRTLIEAMLVGTPVVAAASGGNVEAIRHGSTGLLARGDDPEELAGKVIELIEQPLLAAKIAARARDEAARKFSVASHVAKVTAIYREVLAA